VQVVVLILVVVGALICSGARFAHVKPAAVQIQHAQSPQPSVGDDGQMDVTPVPNDSDTESAPAVKAVVAAAQPAPAAQPVAAVEPVAATAPTQVIHATVTTYQAESSQTDCEPCKTASGVDACHPPYPIVANNGLAFGTKVRIRGTVYVVADRMASRFGLRHFDVLTKGENYALKTEPVEIF